MKKRTKTWFFLLLGLFALPATFFAQSGRADSLRQLLTTAKQDTQRINWLTELAWDINESHTEEAAARLEEAVSLARKLNRPDPSLCCERSRSFRAKPQP